MKTELKGLAAGFLLAVAVALGAVPCAVSPVAAAERTAPKVEIYTTSWCGYCKQAVNYLKKNHIPFTEYDVEKDADAARRWQDISSGGGVPVAVIGKKIVRGFSPEIYSQALSGAKGER